MLLLPVENLLLRSDISIEELRERLAIEIGPPRGLNFLASRPQPYLGKLEGDSFRVWRQFSYRNSFKPIILGKILEVGSGSYVHLVMRPSIAVIIFMAFWFGGAAYALVGMLISILGEKTVGYEQLIGLIPALLIPIGFMIFGYLLMMGGFKFEVRKSKKFFIDLIEPYRVDELGFPSICRVQ